MNDFKIKYRNVYSFFSIFIAVKIRIDVEHMEPTEHSTHSGRTPVSTVEPEGSQNVGQHGASVLSVPSGQNQSSCVNAEASPAPRGIPTTEEILRSVAALIMRNSPPQNWDEHYEFLTYLRNIRATITGTTTGSLLITVKCESLQTLERLWADYLSGHLGKVIQRSFVTEEISTEFSLAELKLKTTVSEEEYEACKAYFEKDLSEFSFKKLFFEVVAQLNLPPPSPQTSFGELVGGRLKVLAA